MVVNMDEFVKIYNQLIEFNAEKLRVINEGIELSAEKFNIKRDKVVSDLHSVAIFMLNKMENEKEFVPNKTRLRYQSTLKVEEDRVKIREYRHNRFYPIEWLNKYHNMRTTDEVVNFLPNNFSDFYTELKTLIEDFEKELNEKKDEKKDGKYYSKHSKIIFTKNVNLEILDFDLDKRVTKRKIGKIEITRNNNHNIKYNIGGLNEHSWHSFPSQEHLLNYVNPDFWNLIEECLKEIEKDKMELMKPAEKFELKYLKLLEKYDFAKIILAKNI